MVLKQKVFEKQSCLFPGLAVDSPWTSTTTVKRHYLKFPFYPFRTLNTQNMMALSPLTDFDSSAPIYPANTQLNLKFRRRKVDTLLNFMLPYNLNYNKGSTDKKLTAAERTTALTFSVPVAGGGGGFTDYLISGVEIVLKDIYLQVEQGRTKNKNKSCFSTYFHFLGVSSKVPVYKS
jgi:hypothetical protein